MQIQVDFQEGQREMDQGFSFHWMFPSSPKSNYNDYFSFITFHMKLCVWINRNPSFRCVIFPSLVVVLVIHYQSFLQLGHCRSCYYGSVFETRDWLHLSGWMHLNTSIIGFIFNLRVQIFAFEGNLHATICNLIKITLIACHKPPHPLIHVQHLLELDWEISWLVLDSKIISSCALYCCWVKSSYFLYQKD